MVEPGEVCSETKPMTNPPTIRQQTTPLLTMLQHCAARSTAAFHTPGHKRGQGIDATLQALTGDRVLGADLPELPELDNLFAPSGVIQQAQDLAAQAFGAERTWFLTNGSTAGVIAAILATCNPGDKIILPRNVHQSAIAGLTLAGAAPIFVQPDYDPGLDLAHSVAPQAIADAFTQHPEAKAVMIVSPTYLGVCADVAAIAELCHQHGLPLLVDEAHGAHFGFHPDLPIAALQAGADLVVQSTHKVLSALTQAAMIHTQGGLIDRDRLTKSLALVQSTSPNYLLLASLDAARRQMAVQGRELLERTLHLVQQARSRIAQIPGLSVLDLPRQHRAGAFDCDATRLTVLVANLGIDGFTADDWLNQHAGVVAELPSLHHLTFIITLGNTPADMDRLVQGWERLAQEFGAPPKDRRPTDREPHAFPTPTPATPAPYTPREAYFAKQEIISVQAAVNRVSAELICPYPPGIPVLVPGEIITAAAIATLQKILTAGGILSGCQDPTFTTVKVLQPLTSSSSSE